MREMAEKVQRQQVGGENGAASRFATYDDADLEKMQRRFSSYDDLLRYVKLYGMHRHFEYNDDDNNAAPSAPAKSASTLFRSR